MDEKQRAEVEQAALDNDSLRPRPARPAESHRAAPGAKQPASNRFSYTVGEKGCSNCGRSSAEHDFVPEVASFVQRNGVLGYLQCPKEAGNAAPESKLHCPSCGYCYLDGHKDDCQAKTRQQVRGAAEKFYCVCSLSATEAEKHTKACMWWNGLLLAKKPVDPVQFEESDEHTSKHPAYEAPRWKVGDRVCFAHDWGKSYPVKAVHPDSKMIEIEGLVGLFGMHIFVAAPFELPPVEVTPLAETPHSIVCPCLDCSDKRVAKNPKPKSVVSPELAGLVYAARNARDWMEGAREMKELKVWIDPVAIQMLNSALSQFSDVEGVIPPNRTSNHDDVQDAAAGER